MRTQIAALGIFAFATLAPAMAFAQDSAAAEALFQKGHQLFEAKKYAEACPKFAESFRIEPLTGSLLALAACHEAEGKLASAWAEYIDVTTRARREGKNDRADAAQQRATTLEPKLAKITVVLAPGAEAVQGLEVKRDGFVVGPGAFGTPLPVDHGEHVIEASAPGREPFTKRVSVQDGTSTPVSIPLLADTSAAEPRVAPLPPGQPEQPAKEPTPFPYRTVGLIAGAAGIVSIGIGGYFGARAISLNEDSNAPGRCVNDVCDAEGKKTRLDAINAGNVSTALIVVGGLLTAGGIALFVVGGPSSPAKPAVAAAPAMSTSSAGFALSGRF